MQQSLFESEYDNTAIRLEMPDANVVYYPHFINAGLAEQYLQLFKKNLAWRQEQIKVYGKTFAVPRLQAWYGDKGSDYQYSNLRLTPLNWTQELLQIKAQCESLSQAQFNSVLANLYRDGNDSMGLHADNEPELGANPVIASVSLGETRQLHFYHQQKKIKHSIWLESGSLLLMQGTTQTFWKHGINKSKKSLHSRVNLTYRRICPL